MMNRISQAFAENDKLLNIYYTAGYPQRDDTVEIARQLYKNGVNMIEIGMPFSDPLADGKTIQKSSQIALKNGMTIDLLFEQITQIRLENDSISIVLMGYLNQVLQYGVNQFLKHAQLAGVDALIIPDLPLDIYLDTYKSLFETYGIKICFLITPQTSEQRLLEISKACTGFLYIVSTFAITGGCLSFNKTNLNYFNKVKALNLSIPQLIGFGIRNRNDFQMASKYAHGAIIGSAFINALDTDQPLSKTIQQFTSTIL